MLKHFITVSSQKNLDNSFDKFDVLSVSGKYGIVNQIKFQGRSLAGKTLTNYKVVNTNDVVYTKSPIKNNPYGVIKVNKHKSGIVSTLYAVYNPTKYVCSNFVELYFNDNLRLNKYLKPIVNIGAKHDMKIANKEVINHNVIFPEVEEQRQICTLFLKLEKLISLQQRKEKLLKQIQQAIYYNIYPEYGTKIPIIRHREFNKDWSIVSFNKLYKKSKEKNDLTYGEDKIISVAKMYFKHESQNSSKDYLKTYNVFKKGDIAFEGNRSEGFSHGRFVQNNIGDGIVSHVFDVFTPLNKENLNYWKYAIHNEHIMKYVLVKSTTKATMMNNLSTKDFLKQKIAVPNSCEMKKISHLLKGLDDQLEFSKRKIKILTKVKQFLLQNMFI